MAFHQIDGNEEGSDKKYLINLDEIAAVEYRAGDSVITIKFSRGNLYCFCVDANTTQTEFGQLRTVLQE